MSHMIENMQTGGWSHAPIISGTGVLRSLGIIFSDLAGDTVTVRADALRQLLMDIARRQPFDIEFYAETYPDIEAARLAGMVGDLHTHFCETGFFEGRLPSEPPFDPEWYAAYYPDLAAVFPPGDANGLRNHFLSAGLAEGRAGTEAELAQTSRRPLEAAGASNKI